MEGGGHGPASLLERESLLAQLAAFQRQARRGEGRLVLIAGEAGAGKTALVEAFAAQRMAGLANAVLVGTCPTTYTSPAFAPIADIAQAVGGRLSHALAASDRAGVIDAFLSLLQRPAASRAVVLEDLHRADAATLELLRIIGRRHRELRCLVIGTYRTDEAGPTHPLREAVAAVPTPAVVELQVPALSPAAVQVLARGSRIDPAVLHRATGGNPFFVTEVLASGAGTVPPSVRDAVRARAARLTRQGRGALHAAAVLGPRWERTLLVAVAECGDRAVDECLRQGMLETEPGSGALRFRHTLAQAAVESALTKPARRRLHARALAVLVASSEREAIEPARLARHALGAGDTAAILLHAAEAGRRAGGLGAHREASGHYLAALEALAPGDDRRRAELLEAHARESRLADDVRAALPSQAGAVACWRAVGDRRREGDALQVLSGLHWFAGEPELARNVAEQAVALLETVRPAGAEHARAHATLGQRYALSGADDDAALGAAGKALRLANRLGDEAVAVHALTTRGVVEVYRNPSRAFPLLEAAARRAMAAELHEEAARALVNLVEAGRDARRYDVADRYRADAMAYVERHHLEILRGRLVSDLAELALACGRWDEAHRLATDLVEEGTTAPITRARALTVLGQLGARRDDGDPWAFLDEALALVGARAEVQDLSPIRAARCEAAWLDGDLPRASLEARQGFAETEPFDTRWWLGEIARWRQMTDAAFRPPDGLPAPYALELGGRHVEAAMRWESIGAPYHAARAMAGASEEADLRRALRMFHALGARRDAARLRARLRELGAGHLPRGPRRSTDRNPYRLTIRQAEVLGLLGEGLTNAEIAARLVVSAKTVDHHVSAVLRKLEVGTRREAARHAERTSVPPQIRELGVSRRS